MTQHATFTLRAVRDCRRYGVDEEEVREVLDHPIAERREPDPGDPDTVFVYSVGRLSDGRALEVMWEQQADRRLVRRVTPFGPEDWSG